MLASNIPAKFNHPWAFSAGGAFIRTVPEASQIGIQNGAASITDGFPPNCFVPIAGGGSWPWGQDANGILNQITAWDRWLSAGGRVAWDSAFSAAIGGYPQGAIVASATTLGLQWLCTVDNNVTNPDTGGAGWISASAGKLLNVRTFATAGTFTYTPTTGTGYVVTEVQGGGGGGGGTVPTAGSGSAIGAPGTSGAYGKSRFTTAFSGATITVGAKGTGGIGAAGTNGGSSSFGALLSAPGGIGGGISAATLVPISGGNGNAVLPSGANIEIGYSDPGGNSLSVSAQCGYGASGGRSRFGGGGQGSTLNTGGVSAGAAGAGGGGSATYSDGSPHTGGDGGVGLVLVWEFSL